MARTIVLGLAAVVVLASVAIAAPGDLDATFAGGTIVTTDVGTSVFVRGVFAEPDGGTIVVGSAASPADTAHPYVFFARFDDTGALDGTYGTGGILAHADGHATMMPFTPSPVARQADGSFIVGAVRDGAGVLLRYLADGTLDATFGGGGAIAMGSPYIVVAPGNGGEFVTAVIPGSSWEVRRFLADGTPDATFGTGGVVDDPGLAAVLVGGVVVAPDDAILVAGSAPGRTWLLVRYAADGTRDASFENAALVPTEVGDATAVVRQPDGKVVVAGSVDPPDEFGVARFGDDGARDLDFGPLGVRVGGAGIGYSGATAVMVDSGGNTIVGGFAADWRSYHTVGPGSMILRTMPDGRLDPTFGAGGKAVIPGAFLERFAMRADGKIVAAGSTPTGVAVARVETQCPAGPDTDADGIPDACDVCVGSQTFVGASLRAKHVPDAAGGAAFHFRGRIPPPGPGPIDPPTNGVTVLLRDATGGGVQSTFVPPGAFNATTKTGWSTFHAGRGFRYTNGDYADGFAWTDGIRRVVITTDDAGGVRVRVDAKGAALPLLSSQLPVQTTVVFTPPRSATGGCATIAFPAASCAATGVDAFRCKAG